MGDNEKEAIMKNNSDKETDIILEPNQEKHNTEKNSTIATQLKMLEKIGKNYYKFKKQKAFYDAKKIIDEKRKLKRREKNRKARRARKIRRQFGG